jgi:hypothetical protein
MLGPLADNGGPTWTHALLPGSPAIDAGDPARMLFNGSTQYFDQRGIGFDRVVGRRIDIGAVERQISPDFNLDGIIDGNDIDLLQANVVHGPSAPTLFDLSGDGVVDTADRDQWLIEAGAANLPSNRPYPLGDANLDGVVDISDFNIWNENKFSFVSHWTSGDFSADGAIDTSDFSIWNEHKFLTADSLPVFTSPRQPLDRNTKNRRIGLNFGARHVAAETIEDDPPTLLSQNVIAAVMKDMIGPK